MALERTALSPEWKALYVWAIMEIQDSADDAAMATFNSVGLRAVRNHENRNVVVDVDVELTAGAETIELKRATALTYSDGSALVCELIVTGVGGKNHSRPESFPNAYGRKYVVLLFQNAVIGVAPIQD
jgi:hypothetical protein